MREKIIEESIQSLEYHTHGPSHSTGERRFAIKFHSTLLI